MAQERSLTEMARKSKSISQDKLAETHQDKLEEKREENLYDFGFTFSNEVSDEDDLISKSTKDEVDDLKNRLQTMSTMFLNLLHNLSRDPDKPMIKWANRKSIIDEQIQKIKELTDNL
jgi:uncharacterized protein (DUF885 family)